MKTKYIAGLLISAVLVVAIVLVLNYAYNSISSPDSNENVIGGQTDEHGCLIGAGYSWDSEVGVCTRNWELNSEEKSAVKIASKEIDFYATAVDVVKLDGEGNFDVTLQRNDNREIFDITLTNWKASEGNYCSEGQRSTDACTMEYWPVCGWFDESIKCFAYPCAQTFSNPCTACSNEKVEYWTEGECPSSQ